MISKPSRYAALLVLACLSWLAAPALLGASDQKNNDKKPATPAPAAAAPKVAAPAPKAGAPAPKAGAPATHATSQPGAPLNGRPGGAAGTGRPAGTSGAAGTKGATKALPHTGTGSVPRVDKSLSAAPPGRRPTQTVQLAGGPATVSRRTGGGVATIHTAGMTISHPLHGPRTVVKEANGRRIVTAGGHGGYVQRAYFSRNGRTYFQRTYVARGASYAAVYRSYSYGGVVYYGYVPTRYYQPVYYGWAYDPWRAPVVYAPAAWGWAGTPWYGFYGGYFAPYPAYAGASQWLADYLLAANLQAAYEARGQGEAGAAEERSASLGGTAASPAMSPQVKQMIAEEVRNQLAAAKAASGAKGAAVNADLPDALNPAERTFVVASHIDVATAAGEECGLGPGDVLMRIADAPDANQNVSASVQSSKRADCAVGKTVSVGVQDLQEMHNQFRQQLDAGLQTLATSAGQGGLPQAPDTTTIGGEVAAPAPDKTAAEQLKSAEQEAESIDKAVPSGSGGS